MRPHSAAILVCCALPLLALVVLALRSSVAGAPAQAPAALGAAVSTAADGSVAGAAGSHGPDSAAAIPTSGPLSGLPARIADRALARAYAAVGRAEMGDGQALANLDDQARARLDEARALLAAQPLIRRFGAASTGSADGRGAQDGASAGSRTAADAPTHGLVLDLSHAVDPTGALCNTPSGPVLIEPGLWAKASYDPGTQRQMVVSDASGGDGYAISLFASDFSTVRLDGGLVVPGRFYQVSGSSVITGAVPCTVDIRPLSALGSYAPAPARPPQSNG